MVRKPREVAWLFAFLCALLLASLTKADPSIPFQCSTTDLDGPVDLSSVDSSDTFYQYRPTPQNSRQHRDIQFQWSASYSHNRDLFEDEKSSLNGFGKTLDADFHNPFGAPYSDIRLAYDYLQHLTTSPYNTPYDTSLGAGDSTPFFIGTPGGGGSTTRDKDHGHIDLYLYKPGQLDNAYGYSYPRFVWKFEDNDTGHDTCLVCQNQDNVITVQGPGGSSSIDLDQTGWTKPDSASDVAVIHEFRHKFAGSNAGWPNNEFWSTASEMLTGSQMYAQGVDLPYGRALLFAGSYEPWRHLGAYLLFNFRGSDTTATLPSTMGTPTGFGDDLVYQWTRTSARTYGGLRGLMADSTCSDCNGYFGAVSNHDRLQMLLHNWHVANYVNNSSLANHQFGYPPQFGFSPKGRGAWQNIDNDGDAGTTVDCINDTLWKPTALTADASWLTKQVSLAGARDVITCGSSVTSHTIIPALAAHYYEIKSDAGLSGGGQDLVVRIEPEGVSLYEDLSDPVTLGGRLMGTVISYSQESGNLWEHPEWADSVVGTQWEEADDDEGALEFVLPNFGASHKAAVVVLSNNVADGSADPEHDLYFPTPPIGIPPDLPYRISCSLRKAPYDSATPTSAVSTASVPDKWPTWSPNGQEIAFRSQLAGASYTQIYRKRIDGGSATAVSGQSANQDHPDWSLRGDKIAFDSESGPGGRDVWVYDTLAASVQCLTSGGSSDTSFAPAIRSDGQSVAYIHDNHNATPETWGIEVINIDGTGGHAISGSTTRIPLKTAPKWSPDGSWLYFARNDSLLAISASGGAIIVPSDTVFKVSSFDLASGQGPLVGEQIKSWPHYGTDEEGAFGITYLPEHRVALRDTTTHDTWERFYSHGYVLGSPSWSKDNTHIAFEKASSASLSDPDILVGQATYDHAPVFTHLVDTLATPGVSFSLNLGATDADGETITYSGAFLPSGSSISGSTFTWSSPPVNCNDRFVVFRAADPSGGVAQRVVKISTRPDVVADLAVMAMGNHKAVLTWSEPDQGDCNAARYLVRSSTASITSGNFDAAAFVDSSIAPGSEGTTHCLEVDSLSYCSPSTYSFAIKTRRAGFWSAMSSVVTGVPTCSGSKPFCDEEGFMAGGGDGGGESKVSRGLGTDHASLGTQSLNLVYTPSSNSLFSGPTGTNASDLLKLSSSAATDTSVELRLAQSGDRQAHVDYLGLAVVDHDPEVSTFAGQSSVFAGVPQEVPSIRDADGQDVSGLIGESYTAKPGDQLFVSMSQGAHPALLVESRGEPGIGNPDSLGILVQRRSGENSWSTIGTLHPRREFEDSAVDASGADTLRLVFLHSYAVRSIAQLTAAVVIQPQAVTLTSATHSRLGPVEDSVATADGNGTVLLSGDELSLSARVSAPTGGNVRDAYLLGNGGFRQPLDGRGQEVRPDGARSAALVATPIWHFALGAARPNPSLGNVTIEYTLAQEIPVSIRVYDVAGRLVKTLVSGTGTPGPHDIPWNASNDDGRKVGPGVYFYRMDAGRWRSQRKVVFLEH